MEDSVERQQNNFDWEVDDAMKAVSKDVRKPKVVRDGIVKEEPKVIIKYKGF
jgi:hypothetical protein